MATEGAASGCNGIGRLIFVVFSSILGLVDPALEVTNDVSVRHPNAVHGPLVGLPVLVS